jgi:hypothetical protein
MVALGIGFSLSVGHQIGADTKLTGYLRAADAMSGLLNSAPLELRVEFSSLRQRNTPACPLTGFFEVSVLSG